MWRILNRNLEDIKTFLCGVIRCSLVADKKGENKYVKENNRSNAR